MLCGSVEFLVLGIQQVAAKQIKDRFVLLSAEKSLCSCVGFHFEGFCTNHRDLFPAFLHIRVSFSPFQNS